MGVESCLAVPHKSQRCCSHDKYADSEHHLVGSASYCLHAPHDEECYDEIIKDEIADCECLYGRIMRETALQRLHAYVFVHISFVFVFRRHVSTHVRIIRIRMSWLSLLAFAPRIHPDYPLAMR